MAQLMTQHAFYFIVSHQVHQARINTYASIRHCPGIDITGHINFIVNWRSINVITQRFRNFIQALSVLAFRARQLIFAIHLLT